MKNKTMYSEPIKGLVELSESLSVQENDDGSISFYEGNDLIARGDDLKGALASLHLNFELRLEFSIDAFLKGAIPDGGFKA